MVLNVAHGTALGHHGTSEAWKKLVAHAMASETMGEIAGYRHEVATAKARMEARH